jgi:RNA polymerase sigma-70 factor (ECF subfamily)
MSDTDWQTSTTLLQRLRSDPADEAAWGKFVDRYGRLVYGWCRKWGLQPADAEDVTQSVLLELARQMRSFEYDPAGRFRGWLKTVAARAWRRFLESRQRVGTSGVEDLLAAAAGEQFVTYLEREADREVLELAMARVRGRVQPHTWEAFRLMAIEGRSGAEAGAAVGMSAAAAFVARSKVQKMIRDEVARLDADEGPE